MLRWLRKKGNRKVARWHASVAGSSLQSYDHRRSRRAGRRGAGVAEPKAAVTDTHPLLFFAGAQTARLGRRARAHFEACERREAMLYVPAAVLWECALLARRGRVDLGRPVRHFFEALF